MAHPSLPQAALLARQAAWLAPARARLLRRAAVARRHCVLDLGAGTGAVTGELVRRASGPVVAVDRETAALRDGSGFGAAHRLCADAARLPLADAAFDLVFCQCALMWMDAPAALDEIRRVLVPGGVLVALEPDYGGMIEHPLALETRGVWMAALARAGADPLAGRQLAGRLRERNFDVRVDLLTEIGAPAPERFALLRGLPLTAAEREQVARAEAADRAIGGRGVAHLPFFLVTAERR